MKTVIVVGAGLAGSEAAFFLAEKGHKVLLFESKKVKQNPAQKLKTAAELVCTNSLKSMKETSAHGLLKKEMELFGSLVLKIGDKTKVPAGDALAVDREKFSEKMEEILRQHKNIEFLDEVVERPDHLLREHSADAVLIASGPLTDKSLAKWIEEEVCGGDFYFYDAIAPIVDGDSLDYEKLYWKNRHQEFEEGEHDYLNVPLSKEEYVQFVEDVVSAEKVPTQSFEDPVFFESCLPIDVMASRGIDTLRFSCMKPIGLHTVDGKRPYAVVQLRKENLLGNAFNIVGFQNRLKYPDQKKIFKSLPGFENADFFSLGSVHRNSFINSKDNLLPNLSWKKDPRVFFAGQIIGVEGYTESASMGIYSALQIDRFLSSLEPLTFPLTTCFGSLINYIMTWEKPCPSSMNWGLLPAIVKEKGKKKLKKSERRLAKAEIVKNSLDNFKGQLCEYL